MAAALVATLSLGAIIGIAVGSCTVLIAAILIPTVLFLKRRHKRALAKLEHDLISRLEAAGGHHIDNREIAAHGWEPEWQQDAWQNHSKDDSDDSAANHHGHIRKPSEVLTWPLPRRKPSKRGPPLRTMIAPRLSAVIESPRSLAPAAGFGPGPVELERYGGWTLTNMMTPPPVSLRPYGTHGYGNSTAREPATWPPARRQQNLILTPHSHQPHALSTYEHKLDRAFSLPDMLSAIPDNALFGTASRCARPLDLPRSISHGSLRAGSQAAEHNLYYPESPLLRFNNERPRFGRKTSENTILTLESSNSSTMKLSEPGFASDSPENQAPSNDAARRQALHDRDKVLKKLVDMTPLALRDVTERSVTRDSRTHSSPGDVLQPSSTNVNVVGQLCKANSVRLAKVSNADEQIDAVTVIRVLSTPKRNAELRRVSACGSPLEKRNPSVLRDISGNEAVPSRDVSQTSLLTMSSQGTSNPFKWESPVHTRPSVLKGSPTSRNKSRKRGSNNVRIVSKPTVFSIPAPQSSCSLLNGQTIEEDSVYCPIHDLGNENEEKTTTKGGASVRALPRPPSIHTFAPELRPKALNFRASLTPSSPTLSWNPYHSEGDPLPALSVARSPQKHIDPLKSAPTGRALDQNGYVSFPTTSFGTDTAAKDTLFEDVPLDDTAAPMITPDSPTLPPELTLMGYRPLEKSNQSGSGTTKARHRPENAGHIGTAIIESDSEFSITLEKHESPAYTFPRSLSPTRKSSATTQVDISDSNATSIRTTPLSSVVDPSNTDSDALAPQQASPRDVHHPLGPRQQPPQNLMKSIKELRRENSEVHHSISEHREARRFLGIGRAPSPILDAAHLLFEISNALEEDADQQAQSEAGFSEKVSVWEDGDKYWEAQAVKTKAARSKLPRSVARQGNLMAGTDAQPGVTQAVPRSRYDSDGFFRG